MLFLLLLLLDTTPLCELVRDFIARFGDEIGSESVVKGKIWRLKASQPKVKKGSKKYTDWSGKVFLQSTCTVSTTDVEIEESHAVLGRPKSRLSDLRLA